MNGRIYDSAEDLLTAKLTTGFDINPDGTITARWHRIKNGCSLGISFTLPPKQTSAPLELWDELEPLVRHFVLATAYGPASPVGKHTEEIAEGEYVELSQDTKQMVERD